HPKALQLPENGHAGRIVGFAIVVGTICHVLPPQLPGVAHMVGGMVFFTQCLHDGPYLGFGANGKYRGDELALSVLMDNLWGFPGHGPVCILPIHQNKATSTMPITARTTPIQFFVLSRSRNNKMPKRVDKSTTPTLFRVKVAALLNCSQRRARIRK